MLPVGNLGTFNLKSINLDEINKPIYSDNES